MTTAEELATQESVQRWHEYYRQHWGPPPDWDFKLQALARFADFVGKSPDQMIGECLREVEGGYKKIRAKKRRFYIQKIKEFEESIGGVQGRNWANAVRSFFIHNGVAMSTDILK